MKKFIAIIIVIFMSSCFSVISYYDSFYSVTIKNSSSKDMELKFFFLPHSKIEEYNKKHPEKRLNFFEFLNVDYFNSSDFNIETISLKRDETIEEKYFITKKSNYQLRETNISIKLFNKETKESGYSFVCINNEKVVNLVDFSFRALLLDHLTNFYTKNPNSAKGISLEYLELKTPYFYQIKETNREAPFFIKTGEKNSKILNIFILSLNSEVDL